MKQKRTSLLYNLVMTKHGFIPIHKVRKGMMVWCGGEWIKAPKPEYAKAIKCTFSTLPTTCFEPQFVKDEVSVYHNPILKKDGELKPGMTVRGYLQEQNIKKDCVFCSHDLSTLSYWYPRVIDFYGTVKPPTIFEDSYKIYTGHETYPKPKELEGDELIERNLEYFLEGLLRKRLYWMDNSFWIGSVTNETARIVLRLLDVDYEYRQNMVKVLNGVSLLRHIKDEESKKFVTDDMIACTLSLSLPVPSYTSCNLILNKEECEQWILPGINPDVNCISTISSSISMNSLRNHHSKKVDNKGRKLQYNSNNLYELLINNL